MKTWPVVSGGAAVRTPSATRLAAGLMAVVLPVAAFAASADAAPTCLGSLAEAEFVQGDGILLGVRVVNDSSAPLLVPEPILRKTVKVSVTSAAGLPLENLGSPDCWAASTDAVLLEPGQGVTLFDWLALRYPLGNPGSYRLDVEYVSDPGSRVAVSAELAKYGPVWTGRAIAPAVEFVVRPADGADRTAAGELLEPNGSGLVTLRRGGQRAALERWPMSRHAAWLAWLDVESRFETAGKIPRIDAFLDAHPDSAYAPLALLAKARTEIRIGQVRAASRTLALVPCEHPWATDECARLRRAVDAGLAPDARGKP